MIIRNLNLDQNDSLSIYAVDGNSNNIMLIRVGKVTEICFRSLKPGNPDKTTCWPISRTFGIKTRKF